MRTLRRRRAILIVAATLLASTTALARVAAGAADSPAPVLASVSPAQVVENGKPIRLVIIGQGLSGVNAVLFAPQLPSRSFTVLGDEVIQVILPADTPPAAYSIRVLTPAGGSDPGAQLEVVIEAAPPPPSAAAAPARPRYSFDPAPGFGPQASATHHPAAGSGPAAARASGALLSIPAANRVPAPPFGAAMVILAGLLAGGLGYALWGSAGRLTTVRRTGLLIQLVGRPGQRLRLAHVCANCARLHWRWTTRADLWRTGDYCSLGCLLDHGDALIEACYADDVASSRLHGMARLEAALEAESAAAGEARAAYLPRLLTDLEPADLEGACLEGHLIGQPMAAVLPAPELVPLPPAHPG